MNDFSAFIEIIEEFIQLFDELIPVEQEKLDAAIKNRITFVEECMNKEQAAVLKLRGLEQKRENAQKALGMEAFTFRQILEQVPEDTARTLRPLFDRLSEQVAAFRSISGSAKDIIEVNLHTIQASLAAEEGAKGTYSPAVKKQDDDGKHFTSRSV